MKLRTVLVASACLLAAGSAALAAKASVGQGPTLVLFKGIAQHRIDNLQQSVHFKTQYRYIDSLGEHGFAAKLTAQGRKIVCGKPYVVVCSPKPVWITLLYATSAQQYSQAELAKLGAGEAICYTQHPVGAAVQVTASLLSQLVKTGRFIEYLPDGTVWRIQHQDGAQDLKLNHDDLAALDKQAGIKWIRPVDDLQAGPADMP